MKFAFRLFMIVIGFVQTGTGQPLFDSGLPVHERVELLMKQPVDTHPDSIRAHIPLLNAYQELAYSKKHTWHTPLADRLDVFYTRAKAHMLGGIFKAVLMSELARSESGVLPVTESAIADLDSAAFYYRKIEPFAEGFILENAAMDGKTARALSDSLKALKRTMQETYSLYPSQLFMPWRAIRLVVDEQILTEQKQAEQSISFWMYIGAKTVQETKRIKLMAGSQ